MDKILFDTDNNTPGTLLNLIVDFIQPDCLVFVLPQTNYLSYVNKYFNKVLTPRICKLTNIFGKIICKKHQLSEYNDMFYIQTQIKNAQRNLNAYVHFETKELADKAEPYVDKSPNCHGRCCNGKGFKCR